MATLSSFLDRVSKTSDQHLINTFWFVFMSNGLLFIGVEKNNDNSKQHYFSTNKHDAAGEIICCEARLEMLQNGIRGFSSYEQIKRPYKSKTMNTAMEEGSRKL